MYVCFFSFVAVRRPLGQCSSSPLHCILHPIFPDVGFGEKIQITPSVRLPVRLLRLALPVRRDVRGQGRGGGSRGAVGGGGGGDPGAVGAVGRRRLGGAAGVELA